MEADFGRASYEAGVLGGIREVARHLAEHFPAYAATRNELPDKPVVL